MQLCSLVLCFVEVFILFRTYRNRIQQTFCLYHHYLPIGRWQDYRLDQTWWQYLAYWTKRQYQWVEKLSQLLAQSGTLSIIDYIIYRKSENKRSQSLLELVGIVTIIYGCSHRPIQLLPKNLRRQATTGICLAPKIKERSQDNTWWIDHC